MKFLIKNYNKDADNSREMLATVLFEVQTIKEAQEKMADFIAKIKNNWEADFSKDRKKFTATAMIVNLYHILDGMDIENYRNGNHEEFLSKFDFNTRKEYVDDETFEMKMPFDSASYNIWQIPLNKFEEYTKKIPDTWLDEDFGFLFSARNY